MRRIYLYLSISLVASVLLPQVVHASGSWTSGEFTFGQEKQVPTNNNFPDCAVRTVKIGGRLSTKQASLCVYTRPFWKYAYYSERTGPSYAPRYDNYLVVSVGLDDSMYKVTNMSTDRALAGPGTNDLIFNVGTMGFTNNHELVMVRDFPSHLERSTQDSEPVYTLKPNSYEALFPNQDGGYITTGSATISTNGRWLGFEIMSGGLAVMDVNTHQIRLFSNYKHHYGAGSDASIKFVISDNGRYIATFDYNIDPRVYELSADCVVSSYNLNDIVAAAPTYQSCPDDSGRLRASIGLQYAGAARGVEADRFNSDGDTLYFPRRETIDETITLDYERPLYAGDYHPAEGLQYLALGDSYSSGEGDIEILTGSLSTRKYYLLGTDTQGDYKKGIPKELCHISSRSYPFLLRQRMGIVDSGMKSVACSGAKRLDVHGFDTTWDGEDPSDYVYLGQKTEVDGRETPRLLPLSPDLQKSLNEAALVNFIPGRVQQIEFVRSNKPKIITLTLGGNDIQFGGILNTCVTSRWTCSWATDQDKFSLGASIRNQYANLRDLYVRLKEASPESLIYVVGYPQFIGQANSLLCDKNISLDAPERRMIREGVSYLNDVIKLAASEAGVMYVDIEDSLSDHVLCDASEEYVTGLSSFLVTANRDNQEMFHPNYKGHKAISDAIAASGGNGGDLRRVVCAGRIICPSGSAPDRLPITDYFTPPPTITDRVTAAVDFVGDGVNNTAQSIKQGADTLVSLNPMLAYPTGTVSIELHSDVVQLGSFMAAPDGSLSAAINIPAATPPGYHTLHAYGKTYSGEDFDYYQVIEVRGQYDTDIDGNGILDTNQSCLYIPELGIDEDRDGIDDICDPVIQLAATDNKATDPKRIAWTNDSLEGYRLTLNDGGRVDSGNNSDKGVLSPSGSIVGPIAHEMSKRTGLTPFYFGLVFIVAGILTTIGLRQIFRVRRKR